MAVSSELFFLQDESQDARSREINAVQATQDRGGDQPDWREYFLRLLTFDGIWAELMEETNDMGQFIAARIGIHSICDEDWELVSPFVGRILSRMWTRWFLATQPSLVQCQSACDKRS